MLFPTFDFLLFAIPVLVGSLGARASTRRPRRCCCSVASYFFYMAGPKTEPPADALVLRRPAGVLDRARLRVRSRDPPPRPGPRVRATSRSAPRARRVRNRWLTASLVGNLGLLGYFKYADFFVEAFVRRRRHPGPSSVSAADLDVVLPLGICFYTFQSLSYTIDVWRGRLTPEPSLRQFALFVAFFPQLVAGPIVRASQFLPQLHRRPRLRPRDIEAGLFRMCKGLAKKVVLGDFIAAQFTDADLRRPRDLHLARDDARRCTPSPCRCTPTSPATPTSRSAWRELLGLRDPGELRPAAPVPRHRRVLAAVAHDPVDLAARLPVLPLVAQPGQPAAGYFNLWLTMFLVGMWHSARDELELRHLRQPASAARCCSIAGTGSAIAAGPWPSGCRVGGRWASTVGIAVAAAGDPVRLELSWPEARRAWPAARRGHVRAVVRLAPAPQDRHRA